VVPLQGSAFAENATPFALRYIAGHDNIKATTRQVERKWYNPSAAIWLSDRIKCVLQTAEVVELADTPS
jgi:hypothetical protein